MRVDFIREKKSVEIASPLPLLEAAALAGVRIETPCGGNGKCQKCRVGYTGGLKEQPGREGSLAGQSALACGAMVTGDVIITTPSPRKGLSILTDGEESTYALDPAVTVRSGEDGLSVHYADKRLCSFEEGSRLLGLGVDIGTTTLTACLVDLATGEALASASRLNPQASWAHDVLSRIKAAANPETLRAMQGAFTDALEDMCRQMCGETGLSGSDIFDVVYAGNTTMLHLALGVDPTPLGRYPYNFTVKGGQDVAAGLPFTNPACRIWIPPVASAFIGADITAGMIVSGLGDDEAATLFIDIGTNGEMVLARGNDFAAASAAAGPAFEGMNISCGMRAADGAIQQWKAGSDGPEVLTIGDAPPEGICGSGLLDIVAELVRVGAIAPGGRFITNPPGAPAWVAGSFYAGDDGKPRFRVAGNVYLTQNDVRQVQLAKGAVRAGSEALLKAAGVSAAQVERVLVAGSFGYHVRFESLTGMGMLNPDFAGRMRAVGNTSQSGANAFLTSVAARERASRLITSTVTLDLSTQDGFDRLFVSSMTF